MVTVIRTLCGDLNAAFEFSGNNYSTLTHWDQVLKENRKREGREPYVFVDPGEIGTTVDPSERGSRMAALPEVDPLIAKFGYGRAGIVIGYRRLRVAQERCLSNFVKSDASLLNAEPKVCTVHFAGDLGNPREVDCNIYNGQLNHWYHIAWHKAFTYHMWWPRQDRDYVVANLPVNERWIGLN